MFDRVLAKYATHSGQELAVKLGVVDSYVTKLRGGWRPSRVRDDLMAKLSALDPGTGAGPGAAFERTPIWGDERRDYYRGMQAAALRMMHTVVELQTEIGEALKAPAGPEGQPPRSRRSRTIPSGGKP